MTRRTTFGTRPLCLLSVSDGRGRRPRRRGELAVAAMLLAVALTAFPTQEAFALRFGGKGNKPLTDPGWPSGAVAIFNHPARIAWWEGGLGGQWHAECRGDAKAFNAVLTDFARLDVKTKRVVVHDGVEQSYWLNPNREPAKRATARIDWIFMVWQPAYWEHPQGPPAQIDVYTGGTLRWSDVTVPEGLEVVDQRLEAHGFTLADGIVLEGKAFDLATGRPVAARVRLERIEPQPRGGYRYVVVAQAAADVQGRWVLKKAPGSGHRVVIEADGFVARVADYAQFDDQPCWHSYDSGLSRPALVSGRVTDEAGQPLADVEVRLLDIVYDSPNEYSFKTDPDGRFRSDQVPVGRATIRLSKRGYCCPGLGRAITTPAKEIELSMLRSAGVRIVVEFAGPRPPGGYIVEIKPEGGLVIGSWGGSGEVDAGGRIAFHDVPPGRYVLQGHPNPYAENQKTEPVPIALKGGQTAVVRLSAK